MKWFILLLGALGQLAAAFEPDPPLCFSDDAPGVSQGGSSQEGRMAQKPPVFSMDQSVLWKNHQSLKCLLADSLKRKQNIPEEVLQAAGAVFKVGVKGKQGLRGHGSGFFLFNQQTFVTNYHVLENLLHHDDFKNFKSVIFLDQKGQKQNFEMKGVKLVSQLRDVAVLEIQDYEGKVLELARDRPSDQGSYIAGYSSPPDFINEMDHPSLTSGGLKTHSVRKSYHHPAGFQYAVLLEMYDCYYGYQFSGASGGPMLNKTGQVEGVFSAMFPTEICHTLFVKKLGFLEALMGDLKVLVTMQEIEEEVQAGLKRFKQLVQEGDEQAQLLLYLAGRHITLDPEEELDVLNRVELLLRPALLGHGLAQYLLIDHVQDMHPGLDDFWEKNQESFLPISWYAMGVIAFFNHDRELACYFFNRAGKTGHPYVYKRFVVLPNNDMFLSETILKCDFF